MYRISFVKQVQYFAAQFMNSLFGVKDILGVIVFEVNRFLDYFAELHFKALGITRQWEGGYHAAA